MDAGVMGEDGYIYVLARDDDVINVAGHRLSTSALEEAILQSDDVIDVAVVGINDELKGQVPLALYVKKDGERDSLFITVPDRYFPFARQLLFV